MKQNRLLFTAFVACSLLGWSTSHADNNDTDASHNDSTHGHASHAGHDHATHDEPDGTHDGHDHVEKEAGPNGGRIITSVEPHLEFYLTDERKVQITFLGEKGDTIPPAKQVVSLIGGDRQNPVRLRFSSQDSVLISDQALPEGNNLPLVLSIKADSRSKTVREKFYLNLSDCSTCDYKEYACICEHGEFSHDDHKGHDH